MEKNLLMLELSFHRKLGINEDTEKGSVTFEICDEQGKILSTAFLSESERKAVKAVL